MISQRSARRSSAGQGLVEYALLVALIAMVVVAGLVTLAPRISSVFQQLDPALSPVATMTTTSATPVPTVAPTAAPTATTVNGNNGCGNNGQGNHGSGNCH